MGGSASSFVSGDKAMNSLVVMFLSVVASWKTQCTGPFSHGGAIFAGLFLCMRLVLYCGALGEYPKMRLGGTLIANSFISATSFLYPDTWVTSLLITYDLVTSNTVFRTMLGEQTVHDFMQFPLTAVGEATRP